MIKGVFAFVVGEDVAKVVEVARVVFVGVETEGAAWDLEVVNHDELGFPDGKEDLEFVAEGPVFVPVCVEVGEERVGELIDDVAELVWGVAEE